MPVKRRSDCLVATEFAENALGDDALSRLSGSDGSGFERHYRVRCGQNASSELGERNSNKIWTNFRGAGHQLIRASNKKTLERSLEH